MGKSWARSQVCCGTAAQRRDYFPFRHCHEPILSTSRIHELLNRSSENRAGMAYAKTDALSRPEGAEIHLLLVTPNDAKKPAPVFVGLNFNGNHALLGDPQIFVPSSWKSPKGLRLEQTRGSEVDTWALDQSIARGYAVATFWNSEVVPDDKDAAEEMLRKFRPSGSAERGLADTATIAAWAWCLS